MKVRESEPPGLSAKKVRESEEVLVKGAGFLDVAEAERRIRNPQDAVEVPAAS